MSSGKRRTKEDTWKAEDLEKSIKNAMLDKSDKRSKPPKTHKISQDSHHRDKESNQRDKESHSRDKDSHQRDRESHPRNKDSHPRNKDSHPHDKDSHPRDKDSHPRDKDSRHRDTDSHHRNKESNQRNKDSHSRDKESHSRDRESHPRNKDSHPRDKDSHHRDRESNQRDKDSHHRDRESHPRDKKSHPRDRESHPRDRESLSRDKESHSRDKEPHSRDKESHSRDRESHSREKERHREKQRRREKERHRESESETIIDKHGDATAPISADKKLHRKSEPSKRVESTKNEALRDKDLGQKCSDGEDYEDDFEDYEDDFEDDNAESEDGGHGNTADAAEVAALRKAMHEENELTMRHNQTTNSSASKTTASDPKPRQSFINFAADKQRRVNTKQMQRGHELLNLIDLDVSAFSLLEMAPVKEYDLYIKSYGRSNTKQAFVQCFDDNLDREVQTEAIDTRHAWTQHSVQQGSLSMSDCNESSEAGRVDTSLINVHSARLAKFLDKASQVMNVLLEEGTAASATSTARNTDGNARHFSQGSILIKSAGCHFLTGRHVTRAHFHPVQTNLLLTVYSMPDAQDQGDIDRCGILCVWNCNDPALPYRILSCKSDLRSCCFSPVKSSFVFAGTVDGAVLAWDLREPSSMHQTVHHSDSDWTLRVPTYSTYSGTGDENHHGVVVSVQAVITTGGIHRGGSTGITGPNKDKDDMYGLSFQLASLDDKGVIHFWVVVELEKTDNAGSETDLGLVPGGKVKIIRSSSIILDSQSRNVSQAVQASCMQFSLRDPNEFYVATDLGYIKHGSRHGDRVSPKYYRKSTDMSVEVLQLDVSPFGLPVFLTGSSDGCICLYDLALASPLITWTCPTANGPILDIRWSHSRPSVFYVLDAMSKIYMWELLKCHGEPVKTEQFSSRRITTIELSNDFGSTGRGLPGRKPAMVIADDKGNVEVHTIHQHYSETSPEELDKTRALLDTFR